MVGIVIVSHSRKLAREIQALAHHAAPAAKIAVAGGVGADATVFGTDPVSIMEAIQSVYSDDGVLMLMDMGSALLSAETAMELLDKQTRENVYLSSAPIVEGSISAAIQSGIGSSMSTVIHELETALAAKETQLSRLSPPSKDVAEPGSSIPDSALQKTFLVTLENGIHARPAAQIVQAVGGLSAEIYLSANNSEPLSAKSFNNITTMNIRMGSTVSVYAWGPEAEQAINTLTALFSELKQAEQSNNIMLSPIPAENHTLRVISVGKVVAPAYNMQNIVPEFTVKTCTDTAKELQNLETAINMAIQQLNQEVENAEQPVQKEILSMHIYILKDPVLRDAAQEAIEVQKFNFAYAWWLVCNNMADRYKNIDNSYMQERSSDVIDIAWRVLQAGNKHYREISLHIEQPSILFIEKLNPALISNAEEKNIVGIVSSHDTPSSHAAIIARAQGIPMLSGYPATKLVPEGQEVILDADRNRLIINPSRKILANYRSEIDKEQVAVRQVEQSAQEPAKTKDGRTIHCYANIGTASEKELWEIQELFKKEIAEGVGLFRTEFSLMSRNSPPDEEEQYQLFLQVLTALRGRPLVIRIFDIGGDKPIPYLSLPREQNPFLGLRGIRFALHQKELLRTQLRAILRAGASGEVRIMLPMVVDEREITECKKIIADLGREMTAQGIDHRVDCPLGIMIETPASVQRSHILASQVDFFSIGSNDLTQYIMAAERGSQSVAALYDSCHPAVLSAIQTTVQAAESTGTELSLCGELADTPEAMPILVGMGITSLSMPPRAIIPCKHRIRSLSYRQCRKIIGELIACQSGTEVRDRIANMRGYKTGKDNNGEN